MRTKKPAAAPTFDDAYRAGADACYARREVTACPYADDDPLASEWRAGWLTVFNAQLEAAKPPRR